MASLCTRTLLTILLCTYLHLTTSAEKVEGLAGGVVSALQLHDHEEGKIRNTINGAGKLTRKMRMMEKMEAFLMDYSPPGSNPKHGPGHP